MLDESQQKGLTANLYEIFALQPDWVGLTHLLPLAVVGMAKQTGNFIC